MSLTGPVDQFADVSSRAYTLKPLPYCLNQKCQVLIIACAVYLGFTPLFNLVKGGVAGGVIGSSFGAIFVIILTMYLLNKQT